MTDNRYVSDAQRAWLTKSGHGGRDMTVRLCDTIDAMLDAIETPVQASNHAEWRNRLIALAAQIRGK